MTADDVGEEESPQLKDSSDKRGTSKRGDTPRTPLKHGSGEYVREKSSRSARKSVKENEDRNTRARSRSAPAKRIVSDGHWKKKRSPPKPALHSGITNSNAPTDLHSENGIRLRPISESKANDKTGFKEQDKSTKQSTDGDEEGIRVYITPPGSRRRLRQSRRKRSDVSDGGNGPRIEGEIEGQSYLGGSLSEEKHSTHDRRLQAESVACISNSNRRRSSAKGVTSVEQSPQTTKGALSETRGSIRSQKNSILNQVFGDSRKRLTIQTPDVIPSPRVPSIEAWLSETPDPFIEADEPPLEFIAPLKPSTERKSSTSKRGAVEPAEDPNGIWKALDTDNGARQKKSGSRRRQRIPSSAIYEGNPFPDDFDSDSGVSVSGKGITSASKLIDLTQNSPDTSPSPLKRRSARKSVSSPIRDRRRSHTSTGPNLRDNGVPSLSLDPKMSSSEYAESTNSTKPPGLNSKRPFLSTGGHRLSTIASVETFSTKHCVPPASNPGGAIEQFNPPLMEEETEATDEARDHFDPISLKRNNSRITKHADLISVLSLPKPSSRSIKSARSIRTNRSRLATATLGDLMRELTNDESKYMRELRTLVDGVIPVLLTCVLSKSDSAVAAGLFRPSAHAKEDPNFTRPIVDMGIALERLKTLHLRIPKDDPSAILTWAHGAQRVYAEYLKAWRMGFQDVVVNLAPADDYDSTTGTQPSASGQGLDEGLPRNEDGDVINGDGERVDVAFLLKRPLVRLKYLQKTMKGINCLAPSAEAEVLATKYQKLVDDARQRSNEERARLEDEAASNIDPTRTRDPKTLAPLAGVVVDRTRRVRARDQFNLALQHSSGQCVDCHVELILRDEASDVGGSGDLLVCEMDATGKWLLFPPLQSGRVSARNGDAEGEIVVMVRGFNGNGSEWQELFSLRSGDEEAGFEWVQMLGLTPIPPKVMRSQSFLSKYQRKKSATPAGLAPSSAPATPTKSRTPSPREIEVPIGEQANDLSKTWNDATMNGLASNQQSPLSRQSQIESQHVSVITPPKSSNYVEQVNDLRSLPSQSLSKEPVPAMPIRTPRSFKEALGLSGTSTTVGLKRTRAKRRSRHDPEPQSSAKSMERNHLRGGSQSETIQKHSPAQYSTGSSLHRRSLSPEESDEIVSCSPKPDAEEAKGTNRPSSHRSRSSVPTMELPYIPKARQNSPPTTPTFEMEQEPEWPPAVDFLNPQPPSKSNQKHQTFSEAETPSDTSPPAIPTHRCSSPVQSSSSKTPVLAKTQIKPRRSSSPLKHEYEPSTASESSSDSDTSTVERNGTTPVSESSEDEDLEEGDAPTPLLPLGALRRLPATKAPLRTSLQSMAEGSIKPSDSASQAPYKTVPAQPTKASKTIASIFSWSDTGMWQSLHPDECSVVITPGLIEAYQMSAAHSNDTPPSSRVPVLDPDVYSDLASNMTSQKDDVRGERPLIALELTPLVPLRRGTALDISIRSPPTPDSQITSGTNIMFRSRNPEECEALYAMINHSRINNPTFIALQNARASGSSFGGDRRTSTTGRGSKQSWFGGWGRSSSYRASSAPTPSIAPSDSSVGSMSSAFSALRRFGRGSGMFNISRSTIASREGSRANSVYTSSDNSSGSGVVSPLPLDAMTAGAHTPIGLSNAKIRLYVRENASKWRDMGSARLTIMRPEKNIEADGKPIGSNGMNEKRIVVNGKTKGEVLLDVQLGESCFERVARTGIAVSVWEDVVGPNGEVGVVGAVGGVSGGRANVYMIQVGLIPPSADGVYRVLTIFADEKRS